MLHTVNVAGIEAAQPQACQYLYFCTRKASALVLVKQVLAGIDAARSFSGISIRTFLYW
jgi:hypothetical protein